MTMVQATCQKTILKRWKTSEKMQLKITLPSQEIFGNMEMVAKFSVKLKTNSK